MTLSHAQLDHFNTQGYLVVENLLDASSLSAIHSEYEALMDRLYDQWASEGKVPPASPEMGFWDKLGLCYQSGFDWYQPFDISLPHHDINEQTPMHFGPAVFDMVRHEKILDIVESLLGGEITSNPIQHVRIKPPQHLVSSDESRAHIVATDWHQDMGVTLPEADQTSFITIWLAITDATLENGCLQIAPGKYQEMLPHCPKNQVGIADPFIPKDKATPVPVKAGGAVIFNPFTPHCSMSNRSDGFRWSFDLRYNVTGQPTGRSQFPEFVARSRAHPETELADWRQWQDMWVKTRSHLAQTAHIDQHRWASDAPYCA